MQSPGETTNQTSGMSNGLSLRGLACIRHERVLFENLDLTLVAGEIAQIEGPNGSGKTSLLRMLCGLLPAAEGDIFWNGSSITDQRPEFLSELLFIGHLAAVKLELTPGENLRMACALARTRADADPEQALQRVGLYGYEDIPAGKLSAGQRRRVALAKLMVIDAKLWVLDEPFTALDPIGRELIEQLLRDHAQEGGISVVTTHHPIELPDGRVQKVSLYK